MSTPVNAAPEVHSVAPAQALAKRPFFWSVRRELWEHRLTYVGPLVAAVVFLFGYMINLIMTRHRMHGGWMFDPAKHYEGLAAPYEFAAALIMGTAFIVGIFYSLDALYGERRDRSILFWKSMPVSDVTAVLAKVTVPLAILPLLSFAITLVTQILMLLLSSVILLGSGVSPAILWHHSSFLQFSVMLLYHIVTIHGLWYAPMYGWLLFVSAWAPRAPFIWAFLPPFVVCGVEKLAFDSTHFLNMLARRLMGPESPATEHAKNAMDAMTALGPLQFFVLPGLWIGLAIAAAFLIAAVRLRRSRGPV
jgi:ABC-2 type transport system permease protein